MIPFSCISLSSLVASASADTSGDTDGISTICASLSCFLDDTS